MSKLHHLPTGFIWNPVLVRIKKYKYLDATMVGCNDKTWVDCSKCPFYDETTQNNCDEDPIKLGVEQFEVIKDE